MEKSSTSFSTASSFDSSSSNKKSGNNTNNSTKRNITRSNSSSSNIQDSNRAISSQQRPFKKKVLRTKVIHKDDNDLNHNRIQSPSPPPPPPLPSSPPKTTTSAILITKTLKLLQKPKHILHKILSNSILQKVISIPLSLLLFILFKKIFLSHHTLEYFFTWMEQHPNKGMAAYFIIYPFHMLLFLPGTPLVMGAGYIFKIRFGWLWGVSLCSVITLFGSLIGSMMCFLLARYCMRGTVRRWSKKYPMFDPIDAGEFFCFCF